MSNVKGKKKFKADEIFNNKLYLLSVFLEFNKNR